jgi:preprotein translocase subunit YajC
MHFPRPVQYSLKQEMQRRAQWRTSHARKRLLEKLRNFKPGDAVIAASGRGVVTKIEEKTLTVFVRAGRQIPVGYSVAAVEHVTEARK